jgi:DNA helicase-2/ATP-dependent DNA helicase PcrA
MEIVEETGELLAGLNAQQRQAVEHDRGPVLVVAGAGTGKTRVITYRIAQLIASGRAKPAEILALTYTDKAAREMEERVDQLVPLGSFDTRVTTFHAFGDHLIREFGLDIGLNLDAPIMTRAEQLVFLRRHLFRLPLKSYRPLGNPTKHLDAILTWISRCKDEAASPQEYLELADGKLKSKSLSPEELSFWTKQLELARCWEVYEELKASEGFIDFGDQVLLALRLLREHPEIRKEVVGRYKYVLVDEFQDTNYAQFELLKLLGEAAAPNLMVVGDDDQSIYKFRGAAISNILQFEEEYPKAERIILTQNYRSPQGLLDASHRLIAHNNPDRLEAKQGIDKKLVAVSEAAAAKPQVRGFAALPREADWVVSEVVKEHDAGRDWSEIAVLVRSRTAAQQFLATLNERGIPFQFSAAEGLYERTEVRTLLDFLRAVTDPFASEALYRLLISDVCRVPVAQMTELLAVARRNHLPLNRVVADEVNTAEFPSGVRRALRDATGKIDELKQAAPQLTVGQLLFRFLDETAYLRRLVAEGTVESEIAIANIRKFFDRLQQYQLVASDPSAAGFVPQMEELISAGDEPAAAEQDLTLDAVQVTTVHAAKGLEFPVVFCVHLLERHFPSDNRSDPLTLAAEMIHEEGLIADPRLAHIQEERRLFYVAMTRAQERLILSYSEQIGGRSARKPSRFIEEATGSKPQAEAPAVSTDAELIGLHAAQPQLPLERSEYRRPITLSSSQIEEYLSCPRKYFLLNILGIPTEPEHTLVYGNAVHQAISEFYTAKLRGKPYTADELVAAFERNWSSEGFHSADHEQERKRQGSATLKMFWKRHQADPKPVEVEHEFKFTVGDVAVIGRLDLVMPFEEGAEVLDFKTSAVSEQKEADKYAKDSLQLSIYALAYQNRYQKLPERLSLSYVESGLVGSVVRTEADIEKTKATISEVAEAIGSGKFDPSPSHPRNCLCRRYEGFNLGSDKV